jgi:hypothetical protein
MERHHLIVAGSVVHVAPHPSPDRSGEIGRTGNLARPARGLLTSGAGPELVGGALDSAVLEAVEPPAQLGPGSA